MTVVRTACCAIACTMCLSAQVLSQTPSGTLPHHSLETVEQLPPEQLPPPRALKGIGNLHVPITASPEAQRWFDQGINLHHDFWDYEAARAFEQSIRVDPSCAMCYWGLYKAESFYHSNSPSYAAPALAKAVSLQDGVTDRERLYIRATSADFPQAAELWRNLTRQYPNDLHAQILLALTLQDGVDEQGEPRRGQQEALEILEHVMTADPQNSAAHHYYVHALEASAHPDRALRSAEILGRLAPASGHVVHMPGHIFFRLGDYARAERAFAASQRVDERYMQKQHVRPDDDWNYVHNLMYAVANLMERGKLKDAITLSTRLSFARGRLETTLYIFSARDSISRLNPRLPVALRTANWNDVLDGLKTSSSPPERPNLAFLAAELATFATGMQALARRDIVMALEQSRKLDTALGQVSGNANSQVVSASQPGESPTLQVLPDALLQPLLRTISIMASELRGAALAATGKVSEAKTVYEQAAQAEKALGYREPPNYIRPVFEAEGAALGAAGEWSAARQAYAQALIERPRSGFSLYGLALCSERLGDSVRAADEYATFLAVWKEADKTLPEVAHARAYLAAHRKATIAATGR